MYTKQILTTWISAVALCISVAPRLALADTVDNPGSFTITVNAGYLKVGMQRVSLDPANPALFSGVVDANGNLTIPASGFNFPEVVVTVPTFGNVIAKIEAPEDATGTIDPISGDSSVQITLRVRLRHSLLPSGCGIGPVSPILTTGISGLLMGESYNQQSGTAIYVNNNVEIPRSSGCGFFGGVIDSFAGLPSPAPNNEVQFDVQFDPILTGS